MISLKNISKEFLIPHQVRDTLKENVLNLFRKTSYEHFFALRDINLEIKKGDFLGIIGKNGSGKSTLLKVLCGIYQPDTGKINIKGRIAPFLELGIGFQPELTGRENIYLNGTLLGLNRNQIKDKFDSIVDFAGVTHFIDLKVKNYSSGMRARLAFSIAKEADADIYLFDEILAVGDEQFQKQCLAVFEEWKKQRKTIVFVSHAPDLVSKFCNRAILIQNGQIVADGLPNEVIDRYHHSL